MVPEFVERIGGSKWQSALPTGSKRNRALPGAQTSVGVWGSAKRSGASPSQPRVGSADRSFPGASGKPENSGTPIYGSRIRVRIGGSKWQSALPTGSKWVQV